MDGIALPIMLLAAGIIALFLEAFIPSAGTLTVAGFLCFVASVWTAFANEGPTTGAVFFLLALILVPATLITAFSLLPKTPVGKIDKRALKEG